MHSHFRNEEENQEKPFRILIKRVKRGANDKVNRISFFVTFRKENRMSDNEKNWNEAVVNVETMLSIARDHPSYSFFYISACIGMLDEYAKGNRSDDLYKEMMNLC